MGIKKLPEIKCYWQHPKLYKNDFIPSVMSRNRFQILLRMLHFFDERAANREDRLYKIAPFLALMNGIFKEQASPGEYLVIDESLGPFRGRLKFRQYIPSKRNRYGIKLFKNCSTTGYTHVFKVYPGAEAQVVRRTAVEGYGQRVVKELTDGYLNSGRTVIADNYFPSVQLADYLQGEQTHLFGTLRKRKDNPPPQQ